MTTINTHYSHSYHVWIATDDTYDGTPDAGQQIVGQGATERESVMDYFIRKEELTCPGCGEIGWHKNTECVRP